MRAAPLALIALTLAGCGSRGKLEPPEGASLPPAPYGATATPTATDLLTPTTQQRPTRGDEIRSAEERPNDPFQLPPR
nr:hypothetical protein [Sphingomonas baiyangensis]